MGRNKKGVYYGRIGDFTLSGGYVFYKRLENDTRNNVWTSKVLTGFNDIYNSNEDTVKKELSWANAAKVLRDTGYAEQQKEIKMLESVFGKTIKSNISIADYPKYINTINMLMGLKKQYGNYLRELQEQAGDTKNRRAAGGFRYFESRVVPAINANVRAALSGFTEEQLMSFKPSQFTEIIRSVLEKSIEDAVYKVANEGAGYIGKEVKMWTEIEEGFRNLNQTNRENFINEVISRYDLMRVSKDIGKELRQYYLDKAKGKNKKLNLSTKIKQKMDVNELKGSSIDGFISEFLTSLLTPANKGTGLVFKNNVMRADSVRLLSGYFEADIPDEIIEQANSIMSDDLWEAEQKIEKFTREVLDKTQDIFIVYESSKMYRLSGSFSKRGFHGSSGNIANLGQALYKYGVTTSKLTINIANLVYQTIPGAIKAGEKDNIIEWVKRLIIENIEATLFDDVEFQSTGKGSNDDRVIHILNLNGVQIPLSYYCLAIADAIEQSIKAKKINIGSYVRVSITTPKNILYPEKVNSDKNNQVTDDEGNVLPFPESVFKAWNNQAADAAENSKFSISFLRNFNDLLTKLIENLKI